MKTGFARGMGVFVACAATVLVAGTLMGARPQAAGEDNDESKIRQGYQSAPVPLNLAGKNRALVGLGSYIVNNQGECNGCHSAGPQTEFLPGGNPFFGQPEQVNPATYLGGGRNFGAFPLAGGGTVDIVSRNLTPDGSGLPIGGDSFAEFLQTIRTGHDPDQLHPNMAPPFRGDLLQVMPWPAYRNMTDRDLRAIYEYLSAIPCIASPGHACN